MESRGRMLAALALKVVKKKADENISTGLSRIIRKPTYFAEGENIEEIQKNTMVTGRDDFSSDDSIKDETYAPHISSDDESDTTIFIEHKKSRMMSSHKTSEEQKENESMETTANSSDQNNETTKEKAKKSRWTKANPENWKYNETKKKRNLGLSFTTKKRKQAAKTPQLVKCDKCAFKCTTKFNDAERSNICKAYWTLEDYNRKKDFILKYTEVCDVSRHRPRKDRTKPRLQSTKCFLLKNGENVRVCRKFFLSTLAINNGPFNTAIKNRCEISGNFKETDRRGKHPPGIKFTEEIKNFVKSHIESFPLTESHYCRKSSNRQYLDSKLSIGKLYELYLEKVSQTNSKPVSLTSYKRIFGTEYNYSFFKPKKDQCALCTKYNSVSGEEKINLEIQYQEHKERESSSLKNKSEDKEKASADSTFITATFDLQSVLQIPCSDVSQMYYSRKICVYNLTLYEGAPPNNALCFAWIEVNGKRGSSEIGTCLYKYLKSLPNHIKSVSLFSDTCGGQNRNRNIAALLLYFVNHEPDHNIEVIEQKFLESGHSMMECDSMHSAIESKKKYASIFTMHDWLNIFRLARSEKRNKKKKYEVTELKYSDFLDLHTLSENLIRNRKINTQKESVNWLKVKCFKFQKNYPTIIQYRYDYTSNYRTLNVYGTGRPKETISLIPQLYQRPNTISKQKYNDLMRLCKTGVIPEEFHGWYKSLKTSKSSKDKNPEPAYGSDSGDEGF